MSRLRFKISMSLDGFVAGPRQSVKDPLGVGGERLHEWVIALDVWREMHGRPGGETNDSSRVVREQTENVGATIMGRNMFGGHPGRWDPVTVGEPRVSGVAPWKGGEGGRDDAGTRTGSRA